MSWLMKSAAWLLLSHFYADASISPNSPLFYLKCCIIYAALYRILGWGFGRAEFL